jgi:hypothetical protein
VSCKVLLVGEGPCDIGDLAKEPSFRKGKEGFLQPLLRTMAGDEIEIEFQGRKLTHLPKKPLGKPRAGKLQAENASQALALAAALGANALVLSFDTDKTSGAPAKRVERQRRLRELRKSAEHGFGHARAGDPDVAAIPTAIAIPCRMIEAWALGDREALAGLLEISPGDLEPYREPEDLWGDDEDRDSSHPKCVWKRVTSDRVEFAEIGAAVAPTALAKACPDSFPPFADDVDRALRACRRRGSTTKPARARRRTR